jgi:hypothetical protein
MESKELQRTMTLGRFTGAPIVKEPLEAGGRGQTLVTTTDALDALLDRIPSDELNAV